MSYSSEETRNKLMEFFRHYLHYHTAVERVEVIEFVTMQSAINGAGIPAMVVDKEAVELPISLEDWQAWGIEFSREWWNISIPYGLRVVIEGEEVFGSFLTHQSSRILDETTEVLGIRSDYVPVLYFADSQGVSHSEYTPPVTGGGVYAWKKDGWDEKSQAELRVNLREVRGVKYDGLNQQPSTSRFSRVLLEEIASGVHTPIIETFSSTLRQILPSLKVGVPSIEDVRSKLEMESKLRIEENVTGSLRPLAFTLEALTGAEKVEYPGLWLVSSESQSLYDIRSSFRTLLLWDAALHVLSAAVKFHGEFKSGLLIGKAFSRTVFVGERRYSKRDSGNVESSYVQVNPIKVVGTAEAISSRLMMMGTHELAHIATYSNISHGESFTTKREAYLNLASDHFLLIKRLVDIAGIDSTRYKPTADRPISAIQFLCEEVGKFPMTMEFLFLRWAALRNVSLTKATAEIESEVERQVLAGRIEMVDGVVRMS